jgi:hypothetical protein
MLVDSMKRPFTVLLGLPAIPLQLKHKEEQDLAQ